MKCPSSIPNTARLLTGIALVAIGLCAASSAWSQQPNAEQTGEQDATEMPAAQPEEAEAEPMPLPEDIDFGALAAPLDRPYVPLKTRQAPAGNADAAIWSRNDNRNGTAAVSVKRPVSSFWDMKAGVDLDVATQASPLRTPATLPDKLASDARYEQSQGSAWMSASAPGVPYLSDQVALEARMNPSRDARVGTILSKSLPIMGDLASLTLKQGFYVTQHDAIPGLPGGISHGRSFDTDRSAQVSIADTGTSFVAGQSRAPTGDRWLNSVGAEQKLFGGLSITGSVSETPEGFSNTSISAGFKKSW
jgi:hypothetical protein